MNNSAFAINLDYGTQNLIFRHLYDDVWGVLLKPKRRWDRPGIIMPSGFQPETGKSYECVVNQTRTDSFIYKGKNHDLWIATLVNKAGIIDQIEYMVEQETRQEKNNPLTDKLASLKNRLPEKHEIVELRVIPDIKKGGKMFDVHYLDEDPRAGGKPSMRFYLHPKVSKLSLNQRLKARVKKVQDTGKVNRKGACILRVQVEII